MRRIRGAWHQKTAFALLLAAGSGSAWAEITLDGSLGGLSEPLAGPEFQIGANLGRQVGSNLFHSFGVFDVNAGESATFNDVGATASVENILSRITGGGASTIDGRLATRFQGPDPNLFFLNPAGVVFGPNASLDVGGSFHVSTADFIELADGARFDTLPSPSDALLTSASPVAFGFLDSRIASIRVLGSTLDGKDLSLIGGNVELDGAMLKAPGGAINAASLASGGKVTLRGGALGLESPGPRGAIAMQESTIDVSEASGSNTGAGSVFIRGGRFVMDGSEVLANTVTGDGGGIDIGLSEGLLVKNGGSIEASTSGPGNAGRITIAAAKEVVLTGALNPDGPARLSSVQSRVLRAGGMESEGNAGNVKIVTERLEIRDGAFISAATTSFGNAGIVDITAKEIVQKGKRDNPQLVAALVATTSGAGTGGKIIINTNTLSLAERARIRVETSGQGDGGDVEITATDTVVLEGESELRVQTISPAGFCGQVGRCGDAGNLVIKTGQLRLSNSEINAGTRGIGNGGDVEIMAGEVVLEGASTLDTAPGTAKGVKGGNITITADRLQVKEGSVIGTSTSGPGNAGDITIAAVKEVVLTGALNPDGTLQLSSVQSRVLRAGGMESEGNAGNIKIVTERLEIRDGAFISAATTSLGNAGIVDITAKEIVQKGKRDSRLNPGLELVAALEATTRGGGTGGKIIINTNKLSLAERARIRVETSGQGDGGDVEITATDTVVLEGESELRVRTTSPARFCGSVGRCGDAGNLVIKTGQLRLSNSEINAGTQGIGNGGDVEIMAGEVVLEGGAVVNAETSGSGSGGQIRISAANIDLRDSSRISSQSTSNALDSGLSGEITIRAAENLRLFNDSHITVATERAGAGDINLDVGFLLHLRDGSSITTSVAGGQGDGGNIAIDPVFTVLDRGSRIVANARQGRGGNIRIVSDFFFASPDSFVSASSDLGIDGTVDIESPETDVVSSALELPASFLDAASLLSDRCSERTAKGSSSLIVSGHGGVPPGPETMLPVYALDLSAKADGGADRPLGEADYGSLISLTRNCAGH